MIDATNRILDGAGLGRLRRHVRRGEADAAPLLLEARPSTSKADHSVISPTLTPHPESNPPGMAWIPGGEFLMGSDDPAPAAADARSTECASMASGST